MTTLTFDSNELFPTLKSYEDFIAKFGLIDDVNETNEHLEEQNQPFDVLVELTDFFGSDHILQLPNGHIIVTDRNSGQSLISINSVDKLELISYINALIDDMDDDTFIDDMD